MIQIEVWDIAAIVGCVLVVGGVGFVSIPAAAAVVGIAIVGIYIYRERAHAAKSPTQPPADSEG